MLRVIKKARFRYGVQDPSQPTSSLYIITFSNRVIAAQRRPLNTLCPRKGKLYMETHIWKKAQKSIDVVEI